MQRYTIFFITVNALRVSGGFCAHHQEYKNWWWAEKLPETYRALTVIKNIVKCCIFLVMIHGLHQSDTSYLF